MKAFKKADPKYVKKSVNSDPGVRVLTTWRCFLSDGKSRTCPDKSILFKKKFLIHKTI
jgi:hypothetical protein